jgi:DNA-directed RNA polymerase subunit H (RpoH/RPB5)
MEDYWQINQVLLEKLSDTGFDVSPEEWQINETLDSFTAAYPDPEALERVFLPQPNSLAAQRNPNGVMLGFPEISESGKVLVGETDRVIKKLFLSEASSLYFITPGLLYHLSAKRLQDIEELYHIVIIPQEQLMFNPTRHYRVPKHELLSPEEAVQWLVTTKLKRSQMPRILSNDTQVIYLDARPNDIIRVIRPSPTIGTFVHHTVVVRSMK